MSDHRLRATERARATDPEAAGRHLLATLRARGSLLVQPHTCPHCSREVREVEGPCSWAYTLTLNGVQSESVVEGVLCSHCSGTGRTRPWRDADDRLALLAYAGHEGAQVVVYNVRDCFGGTVHQVRGVDHEGPLGTWLAGLARWPGAPLAAALGVGWAALPVWERGPMDPGSMVAPIEQHLANLDAYANAPRRALTAASQHLICGCAESREAARETGTSALAVRAIFATAGLNGPFLGGQMRAAVNAAVALLGDEATREAARLSVIGWALGEGVWRG